MLYFLLFISCEENRKEFVFATSSPGATYFKIGEAISESLGDDGFNIEILSGPEYSTIRNCELITEGKVDFALAQNDTPIEEIFRFDSLHDFNDLRSIIPIYPEIIFIIHPDSLEPRDIREVVAGKKVGIGPINSGTARFMKILFETFGIDTTQYTQVYTTFDDNLLTNPDIDVSCAVTGINNPRIIRIIHEQGGKIFSLDDFNLANRGSSVDGFCMNYPRSRPFIIPKNTYGALPESPVLTLAIDAVLVTHKDQESYAIQKFVECLFQNAQSLSNRNTLLGMISENFDPARLNFPLHDGVRAYLERNKPSIFERYAELIGVLFSILVVTFGGLSSFLRQASRRKKASINSYIARLKTYWLKVRAETDLVALAKLEEELFELKISVLTKLDQKRILSDSALSAFLDEWDRINSVLKHKLQTESQG